MSSRSYNYSSLVSAYQCQQLYKYLYLDKIKPEVEQSGDMAFGSAIHFALEQHLRDGDDIVNSFEVYWNGEVKNNLKYGRYKHEELREMGIVLLERFKRLHAKKIKPIQLETRLYGELKGESVEGTPDCIGEFEGIKSIIDFKTSGVRYHKDKAQISEQMTLYNHLYNPDEILQYVYIVFIKGQTPSIQIVKYTPCLTEFTKMLENIETQINQLEILQGANNPVLYSRNTSQCIRGEIMCPFFDKCWRTK